MRQRSMLVTFWILAMLLFALAAWMTTLIFGGNKWYWDSIIGVLAIAGIAYGIMRVRPRPRPSEQSFMNHWEELAAVADWIAKAMLRLPQMEDLPAFADTNCPSEIPTEYDVTGGMIFLQRNYRYDFLSQPSFNTEEATVDPRFYPYLLVHMERQYTKWQANWLGLSKSLVDVHHLTYLLAQKIKVEAEKRTGLNHSISSFQPGTLFVSFPQSVLRCALRGNVPNFRPSGTLGDDPDVVIENGGFVAWAGKEITKQHIQEVYEALAKEVREWAEFRKAAAAYEKVNQSLALVKRKLEESALRKSFRGRCAICPH